MNIKGKNEKNWDQFVFGKGCAGIQQNGSAFRKYSYLQCEVKNRKRTSAIEV